MPNPTTSALHVDSLLTNVSYARIQGAEAFVHAKVFPSLPVMKQSDLLASYVMADFNRDDMQPRAQASESAGGGYNVDNTKTYFCKRWALHKDIDDEQRANADSVYDLNRDTTIYLTHKSLIKKEITFSSNFLVSGIWNTTVTGVASGPTAGQFLQWNDANSTPIQDIRKAITAVSAFGFYPNTLVLGRKVFDALIDNPEIVDRVKYGTQSGKDNISIVDVPELANLLKIKRVLVMNAVYNTAAEGQTEASTFVNSTQALLCYSAESPGIMVPTAAYDFQWRGLEMSINGMRIKNFRLEKLSSDRLEIEMAFDMRVVAPELGYLFNTAVANS